jgi:hypothetical protein
MSSTYVDMPSVFTSLGDVSPAHTQCMRELRTAEVERWHQLSQQKRNTGKISLAAWWRHGMASLFRSHQATNR